MAITSSFSFTNTTAAGFTVTPVEVGEKTNYTPSSTYKQKAAKNDLPYTEAYSNVTASTDQDEALTLTSKPIKSVNNMLPSTAYPSRQKGGVQYQVRLDEMLRTYDNDGNIMFDEPIVAYLTIRHPRSPYITASIVDTIVKRLLGSCYTSAGASRWNDLMRGNVTPSSD